MRAVIVAHFILCIILCLLIAALSCGSSGTDTVTRDAPGGAALQAVFALMISVGCTVRASDSLRVLEDNHHAD